MKIIVKSEVRKKQRVEQSYQLFLPIQYLISNCQLLVLFLSHTHRRTHICFEAHSWCTVWLLTLNGVKPLADWKFKRHVRVKEVWGCPLTSCLYNAVILTYFSSGLHTSNCDMYVVKNKSGAIREGKTSKGSVWPGLTQMLNYVLWKEKEVESNLILIINLHFLQIIKEGHKCWSTPFLYCNYERKKKVGIIWKMWEIKQNDSYSS